MSNNKIKSLKLQRLNESWMKSEDTSIMLADEIKTVTERVEKSVKHQESLTPVHSTPIKLSGNPSNIHDQSTTLENRVSPILLPCTQEPGNEVAWDWQSPLAKSTAARRSRNNGDPIGTPKSTKLFQKKRNSNSPLLYNPIKRKLINNDNQKEDIDKFTAEMKAHMEQIKTVAKDDESRSTKNVNVNTNISNNESLIDIDIDDFAECATKVDFTRSNESISCKKIEMNVGKTSMDDFFDDSIDDSMVKCSQEVEEKLRLQSCHENSGKTNSCSSSNSSKVKDFSWHQKSYTSFLASKEKSSGGTSTNSSSKITSGASIKNSLSACRLQPVTNDPKKSNAATTKSSNSTITSFTNDVKKSNVPSATNSIFSRSSSSSSRSNKNFAVSKPLIKNNPVTTEKETFEIPDDSLDDDFLAVGLDDLVDSTLGKINPIERSSSNNINDNNQSSNRYGRVYVSPHAVLPKDNNSRRPVVSTSKRVLLPPLSQSSSTNQRFDTLFRNSSNNSKFFSTSASNDSVEPLKNPSVQQSQSTATSTIQGRKFFKTKSLSTSNFDDSSSSTKHISTSSSKGPKIENFKYGNSSSSVSTEQQRQTIIPANTCRNNAWPRINGNHDNTRMSNFDRNGRREDGRLMISQSNEKQNGDKETATGSQWICTPEEIERKRLEAKMKLEMKRKLQARSKSAGLLSSGTNNRPVKR